MKPNFCWTGQRKIFRAQWVAWKMKKYLREAQYCLTIKIDLQQTNGIVQTKKIDPSPPKFN